jgi:hypothetical protein
MQQGAKDRIFWCVSDVVLLPSRGAGLLRVRGRQLPCGLQRNGRSTQIAGFGCDLYLKPRAPPSHSSASPLAGCCGSPPPAACCPLALSLQPSLRGGERPFLGGRHAGGGQVLANPKPWRVHRGPSLFKENTC